MRKPGKRLEAPKMPNPPKMQTPQVPQMPKSKPVVGGSAGHIGAPVGSAAHTAAHASFRAKQKPVKSDRGDFSFKQNRADED